MIEFHDLYNANIDWDNETVFDIEVYRWNEDRTKLMYIESRKSVYPELPEDWQFYAVSWFRDTTVRLIKPRNY